MTLDCIQYTALKLEYHAENQLTYRYLMTLIVLYLTCRQRYIDISFYSPSKKKKLFNSNATTWIKKERKENATVETRDHNSETVKGV